MADTKISALTEKTTLHDTDLVPIVDIEATPDETKKVTGGNLKSQVLAGHKDLTTGIHSFDKSCRVWNNATQSIPNATATALTFNTEKWDTDDIHDLISNAQLLTCKTAGKYLVLAAMEFAANATGNRQLYIYLNATQLQSYDIAWTPPAANSQFLSSFCVVNLAVNDNIQAQAYQNSGGNLNSLTVDPYVPQLQMTRLA